MEAPKRIYCRLKHGLGDSVSFAIVCKHFKHYYPDCYLHVDSPRGTKQIYDGIVDEWQQVAYPYRKWGWDIAEYLAYPRNRDWWVGCPSTKPAKCLHDIFKLEPLNHLFTYSCGVTQEQTDSVAAYYESISTGNVVLIHHEGRSSPEDKNLTVGEVRELCERLIHNGATPVILDWSNDGHPLVDQERVFCPNELWERERWAEAGLVTALIQQAALMIGIDSGPEHLAGATETPTFVVWTEHHPINNYDLADNVHHLIAEDVHSEFYSDMSVMDYFISQYDFSCYSDCDWLWALNEKLEQFGL